jgi:hypothetical protein
MFTTEASFVHVDVLAAEVKSETIQTRIHILLTYFILLAAAVECQTMKKKTKNT